MNLTKDEILEKMRIEMPFHLPDRLRPYIEEAMQLYADQEAKLILENSNNLLSELKQLKEKYEAENPALNKGAVITSALKEGDVIDISGYYFHWVVKKGYSELLKKEGIYAIAQGGLIHSDLEGIRILRINGKKVV